MCVSPAVEETAADACFQTSGTCIALVAQLESLASCLVFSLDPKITFCPRSNQARVLECPYSGRQVDGWNKQTHQFFTTKGKKVSRSFAPAVHCLDSLR